jgi:hypothetical protein
MGVFFQVLPTAICFFDGITKNGQRQIGFIGLEPVPGGGEDDWPTSALEAVLGSTGVLNYTAQVRIDTIKGRVAPVQCDLDQSKFLQNIKPFVYLTRIDEFGGDIM